MPPLHLGLFHLAKLMKDTTYIHAGKPAMKGRQQNIEMALVLL
jgi:hypothetical protein